MLYTIGNVGCRCFPGQIFQADLAHRKFFHYQQTIFFLEGVKNVGRGTGVSRVMRNTNLVKRATTRLLNKRHLTRETKTIGSHLRVMIRAKPLGL